MPVTKHSPVKEIRKKIVNTKPAKPKEDTKQVLPEIIPAKAFNESIERADKLCSSLIAAKKAMKKTGNDKLSGSYRRSATELGSLLGSIVSTIKATAITIVDAQTKAQGIATSNLPKEARHAAEEVLKQLRGSHRRIKELNADVKNALSKSKRGIEPAMIQSFLPDMKDIYNTANTARIDADRLYKTWSTALMSRKTKHISAIPEFKSLPALSKPGEANTPIEKKNLDKITKALNLGAVEFPNPYTVMWKYYGDNSLALDNDVRNVVRLAVMYAARSKTTPKQFSILELYKNGDLLKTTQKGEVFDASDFNTNFVNAVKSLLKKMKTDSKCKDFVFEHYERADDNTFETAINHLSRDDSRGKSLVENARKHYIEDCRNWFITYLPKL